MFSVRNRPVSRAHCRASSSAIPQTKAPLIATEAMSAERVEKVRMALSSNGCLRQDTSGCGYQTPRKIGLGRTPDMPWL